MLDEAGSRWLEVDGLALLHHPDCSLPRNILQIRGYLTMDIKARLRVKCAYCGALSVVIIFEQPRIRVKRNFCLFCGSRVEPLREDNNKTIDSFLKP